MIGKAKIVYLGLKPRNFSRRKFENLLKKSKNLRFSERSANIEAVRSGIYGYLTDSFVSSKVEQFVGDWDYLIFVTRHPIENNWFTRSNYSFEGSHTGKPWIVATTYELDEFCEKAGMPLEKALAGSISVSVFSAFFVKQGGEYWHLWSDAPEESPFGWCEEKEQILDGFDSKDIGERARSVIRSESISDEIIYALEKDHKAFKLGFWDKTRYWIDRNSNLFFFVLGALVSAMLTYFSTSA